MLNRELQDLEDMRLVYRGNKILSDLFTSSVSSIRQICRNESESKAFYRFIQNERVSEDDLIYNMKLNCQSSCKGKYVVCIQDSTEINLTSHSKRINKDDFIGTTNCSNTTGLGFFIHPSLVLDARDGMPYGYSNVKIWNRPLVFKSKVEREYTKIPITEKESFKWIDVSMKTKEALSDIVEGMVIIQDREGDIYEQFATIPDKKTDLLIRASANRTLAKKDKLFDCVKNQKSQGSYLIEVKGTESRKKRTAKIEIRFKEIELVKTGGTSKEVKPKTNLFYIEAKEIGYDGKDKICWKLLTSISVDNVDIAKMCIEWYSWRWTIEEVFKILKKEGFDIERSELEYSSSIRKMSLMIMEVIIKLFLMRFAYSEPEMEIEPGTCFNTTEQEFLEQQIKYLEGKTEKQKNPYKKKDLKRFVWAIARMGGWKGYESKRRPGITTLWNGIKYFKSAIQGWELNRNVSTR